MLAYILVSTVQRQSQSFQNEGAVRGTPGMGGEGVDLHRPPLYKVKFPYGRGGAELLTEGIQATLTALAAVLYMENHLSISKHKTKQTKHRRPI